MFSNLCVFLNWHELINLAILNECLGKKKCPFSLKYTFLKEIKWVKQSLKRPSLLLSWRQTFKTGTFSKLERRALRKNEQTMSAENWIYTRIKANERHLQWIKNGEFYATQFLVWVAFWKKNSKRRYSSTRRMWCSDQCERRNIIQV